MDNRDAIIHLRWMADNLCRNRDTTSITAAGYATRLLYDMPQPDSETGLMPCGCGGKAEVVVTQTGYSGHKVACPSCGIETRAYGTVDSAVAAWNRSMGWKND